MGSENQIGRMGLLGTAVTHVENMNASFDVAPIVQGIEALRKELAEKDTTPRVQPIINLPGPIIDLPTPQVTLNVPEPIVNVSVDLSEIKKLARAIMLLAMMETCATCAWLIITMMRG